MSAKTEKLSKKLDEEKQKYHFDNETEQFFVDSNMPFDNRIHPRLRHLHKDSTKLKCNKCGFMGHAELHQDCIMIPFSDDDKCTGLMCGF